MAGSGGGLSQTIDPKDIMASKKIHFRQETPVPDKGHQKGNNGAGYHGPSIQLETAPGRMGKAGYVRIKKG